MIVSVAGLITTVGAAAVLIGAGLQRFFSWPVAEIWLDPPRGDETTGRLSVTNKGDHRIEIVAMRVVWPRGVLLDDVPIARMLLVLGSPQWDPQYAERPPRYRPSLSGAVSIEPGGKGLWDFAAKGEIVSATPWALIQIRSARFIARNSWMPVKMLHRATAKTIQS